DLLVDARELLVQLLRLGLLLGAEILVQLVDPRLEVLPRLGRVEAASQGEGRETEPGASDHLVSELHPAVLGPRLLVVALAHRPVLSVAHGVQLRRGNTQVNQVLPDAGRAPVGELEVVLLGAALVGVALEGDLLEGALLDAVGELVELGASLGAQGALVEGEVDRVPVASVRGGLRAGARLAGLPRGAVVGGRTGVGPAEAVLAPGARGAVGVRGASLGRALAVGTGGARRAVLVGGALGLGGALVALAD